MRLPSENVLDVLQCVDFATLLALQRSGSAFYDAVHRNQSLLPQLRVFTLDLNYARGVHKLREIVGAANNTVLKSPRFSPTAVDIDYSLLRTFRDTVGTNFVDTVTVVCTDRPVAPEELDMHKAVDALPALKHIRSLYFKCGGPTLPSWSVDSNLLRKVMKPLENVQRLSLYEVDIQTDWTFLRDEWALRLRLLSLVHGETFPSAYPEIDSSGQAEILEYITDFVHLPKGKSKMVRLHGWEISQEFLQRVVKKVAECSEWITVELGLGRSTPGFAGSDEDYARCVLRIGHEYTDLVDEVRYSSRIGSHRVIALRTLLDDAVLVTNNPFVTSFRENR